MFSSACVLRVVLYRQTLASSAVDDLDLAGALVEKEAHKQKVPEGYHQ